MGEPGLLWMATTVLGEEAGEEQHGQLAKEVQSGAEAEAAHCDHLEEPGVREEVREADEEEQEGHAQGRRAQAA